MVLREHFGSNKNPWFETIRRGFYSDNLVLSVETPNDALALSDAAFKRCKEGGFHLRKWASNSTQVERAIPEPLKGKERSLVVSVLGLDWDRQSDQISLRCGIELTSGQVTRQIALRALAKVYDPLGLLAPCTLEMKFFVQESWKAKVGWKDPLPDQPVKGTKEIGVPQDAQFRKFVSGLNILRNIKIS